MFGTRRPGCRGRSRYLPFPRTSPGGAVPAVSLLVLAVLAQPVQHRVEVLGQGGDSFWSAGARGSDLWERVRGDIQLEVRRPAAPLADATAPAWPGALRGTGVGGSGTDSLRVLYGSVPSPPSPSPSSQAGAMQPPSTPSPANAAPAGPLPSTPPPANAAPATALPTTPTPASDAPLLPPTAAPANGAPGLAPPATPPPANSSPALPLPTTPSTAPGPAHGGTTAPGPTWFPSPPPPSPGPDAPLRETEGTRFARADTKIDPSGQASTVRLRVRLRARTLDLSRNVARIALADRS